MIDRRRFLAASAGLTLLPWLHSAEKAPPSSNDSNAFALDLFKELRGTAGNVFCSPFSIRTALAMTAAGAKGSTLSQMQTVLHLGAGSDAEYAKIAKALDGKSKEIKLATANALWAQPGYPWNPAYTKRVKEVFHAGVFDTDYAKDPTASRAAINAWVEKQTNDKIKDLMPEGSIDRSTRLVLTNAIYFKGDWITAFDKKLTKDAPFTAAGGAKKDVPLMYRSGTIGWNETESTQLIKLPYKGNEISFVAAMPKSADQFGKWQESAREDLLGLGTAAKPAHDVKVWLPRFKVETRYELNDTLKKMGMPDAFSGKADFGGMTTTASELVISLVIHKAYVDVNEEGTEAAAATGVGMKLSSMPVQEKPKVFRADRPFLFALMHEPTHTMLFLGRYEKP